MKKLTPIQVTEYFYFLLSLMTLVLLWVYYPHQLTMLDPWAYSEAAFNILTKRELGTGYIFDHRLMLTVPVAVIYGLFGISAYSSHLWPLFCCLLIVAIIYFSVLGTRNKVLALALILGSPSFFYSSTELYPDIIATAFMCLSAYFLFRREQFYLGGVLASASLFLAFLAKESSYWLTPVYLLFFFKDCLKRPLANIRFHLQFTGNGLLLTCGYLIFCKLVWGDYFARLSSLSSLTGTHLWSWSRQSDNALLERLTTGPILLITEYYGAFILVLAVLGLVHLTTWAKPWAWYTLFCLFFFWFGSTSFKSYEPMPLVSRMLLPLFPGLVILAVNGMESILRRWGLHTRTILISIFTILALSPQIIKISGWSELERGESGAIKIIREDLDKNQNPIVLITSDTRSAKALQFYFSYRLPQELKIIYAGDLKANYAPVGSTYLYINHARSKFLSHAYGEKNYDRMIQGSGAQLIFKSRTVELFYFNASAQNRPNN